MRVLVKYLFQKLMIWLSLFLKHNDYASIYYHDVVLGKGDSFNKINLDKFRAQMKYLFENKYKTLTFSDLDKLALVDNKSVLITFDDGYSSNFDLVYPIMKEYNLKFNIFIEVGAINVKSNYLSWDMIKEMNDSGLAGFGAHTFSHVDSRYINDDTYEQEIELPNKLISGHIGIGISDYCFPFGAYNHNIVSYLENKKVYSRLYTSDGSKNTCLNEMWLLGRVGIEDGDSINLFIDKLDGKLNLYYKIRRTLKEFIKGPEPKYSR